MLIDILKSVLINMQLNTVIMTSIYAKPHLKRQMFCGTNYFIAANHNIILLSYNNTCL